ncbi:LytR/AlgR family response regulator transcription factor [Xylocopilactobacillus apicola]|uniref:DNA-binding response regulator n=1 Tax=Xylocopilactobacillus apicola TaxID=2932184 RepID=A0AAU9D5N6_9LACO|nr:LytTR family DNA-binding domain-containing protein [Xylocopilactobacillus apicola]BDR59124.1 DNA-binding response regulator [Xylocopilactobacillus apicola]
MIKIYVCDDQEIHLLAIKKIIEDAILFAEVPMQIELASTDPVEIAEHFEPSETNVYFLDIDLSNETYDGLKLAIKIRESDPRGFIIFITSHLEFGMLTFEYKLGTFDYIVKTPDPALLKNRVESTLKAIAERYQTEQVNQEQENHPKRIKFTSDYEEKYVPINELIMLEIVGNHKLQVMSKHQNFECNGSLGKLEYELPNYFFRCHRSTIINLKEVVSRSAKDEIISMSNGAELQCSRRQQKKFEKLLNEFNLQPYSK